jgi:anti-anti-sigma factor
MIDRTLETKTASFKLVGDWDFSRRNELQVMLRPAEAADEVLLDFSAVTFIDASVLGSLIGLLNRVVERNRLGTIRIVAASRQVTRILGLCHLETLFGLSEPVNAAFISNEFVESPGRRGTEFKIA